MRINTGDTAWVLASAALVLFMTPGLALFYGGMVRAKNVLAHAHAELLLPWASSACCGPRCAYSLAFHGTGKWIGNLDLAWMHDVERRSPATGFGACRSRRSSFSAFQLMFAIITPALITGAIADRMKFSAWFWFLGLWADRRVHAGRALGVLARGLAVPARRARLRRRHRRAHQRRRSPRSPRSS